MGIFLNKLEERLEWDCVALTYPKTVRVNALKNAIIEAIDERDEDRAIEDEKLHKSSLDSIDI